MHRPLTGRILSSFTRHGGWSAGSTTQFGSTTTTATLIHENPRLRILDCRTQSGCTASTILSFPTVRWRVLDASEPTPPPAFYPAGTEVSTTNSGEQERRDLVFEILQEPRYSDADVRRLMTAACWPTAPGQVLMLENSLVKMWDFRSSLGMDRQDTDQPEPGAWS